MTHRPLALALAAGTGLAFLVGVPGLSAVADGLGERRALAQPSSEARAGAAALFEDARRLMSEGKYAVACPKLAESQRVDPGMGTLYQLSVCYEAIGRTASAWVGFRDVAGQALTSGLADREKAARGKAAALEPKLMRLKITGANGGPGVEVKRDGAVVSPALWGMPLPLDPGPHKVSATGPNKEPWEVTVVLEQPGGVVNVDVPPLLEKKAGSAGVGPSVEGPQTGPTGPVLGGAVPPPPPPEEGAPRRPWQMPLGVAATVIGAAGLGTGVAFGFMAKSSFNDSNTAAGGCSATTNHCTSTVGLGERSDAVNKGNIGTGVFIAGAVVAAGGIVLWITAPARGPRVGATALPQVGLGPSGVSLRGAW